MIHICIKLIDQKIRFLRKKGTCGGGGKITIDYRPKELKNAQYSRRVLSSTTRIPPYESRFPAQNAPIISSIISIFLADKPGWFWSYTHPHTKLGRKKCLDFRARVNMFLCQKTLDCWCLKNHKPEILHCIFNGSTKLILVNLIFEFQKPKIDHNFFNNRVRASLKPLLDSHLFEAHLNQQQAQTRG